MLAIADSGLGGITVLKAIWQAYGNLEIVCLADQKNAPYGNQSPEKIIEHAQACLSWLIKQGATTVFFACNTTSSVALPTLRAQYPEIKIEGIIDLTAQQVIGQGHKNILVLATQATVNSNAYLDYLKVYSPDSQVSQLALVDLVDLLEGEASDEDITSYLAEVLGPYQKGYDAVILGCTHYVLVKDTISELLGGVVYDSCQAIKEADFIEKDNYGEMAIYTTKDADNLERQMAELLEVDWSAKLVEL